MTLYWILSRINWNGDEVYYNPVYKYHDSCHVWGAHWYTTKRSAERARKRLGSDWEIQSLEVEMV